MRALVIFLMFFSTSVFAGIVEGVDFPNEVSVGTEKLVLNGAGLRTKRKFGLNFKVYVAGLYAPAKTMDPKKLITGTETKVLELVFLRSIDAKTLREAWTEGFDKNCGADCDAARSSLKAFNEFMKDVKEKHRLKLTFKVQDVVVELQGDESRTTQFAGEAFRRALLALFIGDQPPTPELKNALLGVK